MTERSFGLFFPKYTISFVTFLVIYFRSLTATCNHTSVEWAHSRPANWLKRWRPFDCSRYWSFDWNSLPRNSLRRRDFHKANRDARLEASVSGSLLKTLHLPALATRPLILNGSFTLRSSLIRPHENELCELCDLVNKSNRAPWFHRCA